MADRRQLILDTIDDLVTSFLYYDRKEHDSLPVGAIEEAVAEGEIAVAEIVAEFEKAILHNLT